MNHKKELPHEYNEIFLKQALSCAKLGYCIFNIVTDTYEHVSEEYANIFGYTAKEYMARFINLEDDITIVIPDDREMLRHEYDQCENNGDCLDIEYCIYHADGSIRTVREVAEPIITDEGLVTHSLCLIQDITESRQAQISLHERKERERSEKKLLISDLRLKMVIKASDCVIWDWNIITNELDWDDAYYQVFGYTEEDTLPTLESWTDFIHPDDIKPTLDSLYKVVESGEKQWTAEYRFKKKDGSYAFTLDWGAIIHDENGKKARAYDWLNARHH